MRQFIARPFDRIEKTLHINSSLPGPVLSDPHLVMRFLPTTQGRHHDEWLQAEGLNRDLKPAFQGFFLRRCSAIATNMPAATGNISSR